MSEPLTKGMHDFKKLYWSIKFIAHLVNLWWGYFVLGWSPQKRTFGDN